MITIGEIFVKDISSFTVMGKRDLSDPKYVRLYKYQIEAIEDYRASKRPIPEFSEVLREIVDSWLEGKRGKE